jgi:hypothetical protein
METIFVVLARALILSFVLCCVFSGILQVFAWSRHAREGATVSLRALRHPEGYFDAIGQRQIGVARALLTVGGVAYLSYGVLLVVTTVLK